MFTDKQLREIVSYLRPGDQLRVVVFPSRHSRIGWEIRILCNRQAWPSDWVKGGYTSYVFVGHSHKKETAAKRAESIIKKLQRLREPVL